MSNTDLNSKVKELRELKTMAAEIADAIDTLQDEIKSVMTELATDTLKGIDWKITWKSYTQSRLDTKKLEEDLGDLSEYKKITTYKQFRLS